ncbi:MAG TPA: taurine dioxygenase [Rhodospirillaceae bacterium]|nr:taurine dioxygenase [Rhodospirillaceae bacterium]HAT35698.1 taurine dioxygenase [Rhodospirillaceae bacterium]
MAHKTSPYGSSYSRHLPNPPIMCYRSADGSSLHIGLPKMPVNGGELEIVPSGDALAAEVRGVDLSRPLEDSDFAIIEHAFNTHSVLCFRDQDLTPEQLVAYATRYGEPQRLFLNHYAMKEHPEILYVSNIQENGRDIGYADAGIVWHTDMSFEKTPPRATVLHAREIPVTEDGTVLGDTLFASAIKAYDSLSDAMKERLNGLRVVHDAAGRRRKTGTGVSSDNEQHENHDLTVHPVVRRHPYTGEKILYVSSGECEVIEGMADGEAVELIDELAATIIRDEFIHRHKWQMGDVLMWDNCAVQHLAIHDYELPLRRMMWRITVGYTDVYE